MGKEGFRELQVWRKAKDLANSHNLSPMAYNLFFRKYIFDISIAAIFIVFALVLAEKPSVNYSLTGKERKALPAVSGKVSGKKTQEKTATGSASESLRLSEGAGAAKVSNKNPDPSDFNTDEFRIQGKDVLKLYEAIKSDGYRPATVNSGGKIIERPKAGNRIEQPDAGNIIAWLNGLLRTTDFYDKIAEKKPELTLTSEIIKLREQTEGKRKGPFRDLKEDYQKAIKRLNRLLLELAYPKETPKSRNLEVRNIFEPDGNYEKPKELIIIPENPYNLIAVLEGKEKKAILREYTGRMVSLKVGDKMIDGAVVIKIDKMSVTAKKGKKEKEYKIFDVKKKPVGGKK